MPPKRKAANSVAAAGTAPDYSKMTVAQLKAECTKQGLDVTGKKADLVQRLEDAEGGGSPAKMQKQSTIQKAMEQMRTAAAGDKNRKRTHKVDQHCNITGEVYEDYDCMLNQTNIGHNNNKFYVIQVIKQGNKFYTFNRWGRVGEPGQQAAKSFNSEEQAIKDFCKKFTDKTKNDWEDRDKFKPVTGKYTLLEMGDDGDDHAEQVTVKLTDQSGKTTSQKTKPCTLEKDTKELVQLLFDNDMFKEALMKMDIDVKKMPLGKLSKIQIVKGFEVLDEIKQVLDQSKPNQAKLQELSSKFYTVIPHDFGRQRPPTIGTQDMLRQKLDMLITLGDIEMTQDMLKHKDQLVKQETDDLPLHPLDEQYLMLKCKLGVVQPNEPEYKIIETYWKSTGQGYCSTKLLGLWRVDREPEGARFKAHDNIKERKLLWHGTNVAVVAAILKAGLRIMPHSGGRVGRGIYFASENSKSAGYVRSVNKTGIMFLNEVALGKEKHIFQDDSRLTAAPSGYDSIVARGVTEPDPKKDTKLTLDGKQIIVPQGSPIKQEDVKQSSFSQSEYLVYKESQVRIRYLLKLQWSY